MNPSSRIMRNKRLKNMTLRELIGLKKRVEVEIKLKRRRNETRIP